MRHIRAAAAALFCFAAFAAQTAFAAEEAAGSGGHEEKSAGLPQLDASTFPSQLLWLAVTFGILYLYYSRKALPQISSVIENRYEHIQSDLGMAESLRKEAAEAQHTYEQLMENARAEATKLMTDAEAGVRAKTEKALAGLREKGAKDMDALEKRLSQAKLQAMGDMNTIAADIASRAAEKIVGIKPDLQQAQTVVQALNRREAA